MEEESGMPRLTLIVALAAGVLSVGATFYHFVEQLSWLDAFYLATVTLTTVGYGDISPKTDGGRLFTIFYVIVGIGLFAALLDALGQRREAHFRRRKERRQAREKKG